MTFTGTLTLPSGKLLSPAVILITGSGTQNRDEEIYGFKIFKIIADHLARKGFAVLRYDDRGMGGSSRGNINETSMDYAKDAYAGLKYLRGRKEINPDKIGFLGHSESGLIAELIASEHNDVAFIILMAGTTIPGEQIIYKQLELILRADTVKEEKITKALEQQKKVFNVIRKGEGWDELEQELIKETIEDLKNTPEEKRKGITNIEKFASGRIKMQLKPAKSEWFKFFSLYNPADAIVKIKCPILALFGELDLQVPADLNRDALEKALLKVNKTDYEVKIFPKANHLFQFANNGNPSEYAQLKKEFVPNFLNTISDWLEKNISKQ